MRKEFHVTKSYTYFANAAISPIPTSPVEATLRFYDSMLNHAVLYGRTGWKKQSKQARYVQSSL